MNKLILEQYLEMRKFGKLGLNVFFWSVKFVTLTVHNIYHNRTRSNPSSATTFRDRVYRYQFCTNQLKMYDKQTPANIVV